MDYKPPKRNVRSGPEAKFAREMMDYMEKRGWACMKVGGGKFTVGWPDYYCIHPQFGHRWIETKDKSAKLRPSQVSRFGKLSKYGDKVWVFEPGRSVSTQYKSLFSGKDNWRQYQRGW